MKRKIIFLFFVAIIFAKAQAQNNASNLASTIMHIWKDSFALDNKSAKWTYDMGVILKGMEGLWYNTGNADYYKYIQKQIDFFVKDDGSIKTYKPDEFNIDNINNGKILLLLYRVTQKEKYLKAANLLWQQLQNHPRTASNNFWHKKIYPNQVWLDGLYMAQPFYAEYAMLSGKDSCFNDIANQFITIYKQTKDSGTGLLYHAWDESRKMPWSNSSTGCSPLFWSRAMGWYATALVDVLDFFPENHPKRKELITILQSLVNALQKQQDAKTGLWKDILAYSGEGKEKNYFEASASCQFVYAIAKGVRKKYLPSSKLLIAKKGYQGIIQNFLKVKDLQTNLEGTVKVSGLGGNPYRDGSFTYYMSEPVITNDPKGMGAFLLAANEMELLPIQNLGAGKNIVMDNYFNRETKIDAWGNTIVHHYKWNEKDNGGFSVVNHIINKFGATTTLLNEAPTLQNLKNATAYFLIDPDWPKENKTPNYIEQKHIEALVAYVKNGGILIMLANDSNNVEFDNYNKLAQKFGIHWNINVRHDVKNDVFEQGVVDLKKASTNIFTVNKAYIKQLCTQTLHFPAKGVYNENGEVLISMVNYGKGKVFAVGDPWFYNEYTDGRKLPKEYENYKAAEDLIKWILKK